MDSEYWETDLAYEFLLDVAYLTNMAASPSEKKCNHPVVLRTLTNALGSRVLA